MSNAPIIAWSAETDHRLATEQEIASFAFATNGVFRYHDGRVIRRLSCSDPVDMRAIWYLAALALGASEKDARRTSLVAIYINERQEHILGWGLTCPRFHSFFDLGHCLPAYWCGNADTDEDATVALCAAVWGPK